MTLWTVAHQAPLSVGFSRQGSWSGLPCPLPPGDLPNPGIKPRSHISCCLRWQAGSSALPVKLLSRVQLFAAPRTACSTPGFPVLHPLPECAQIPSDQLDLCRPLVLLPSIFPSIRVFSKQSTLCIRWPKCCGFSFISSPSKECSG